MNDEGRPRAGSLKDKLDGFLTDWRRSRSKSVKPSETPAPGASHPHEHRDVCEISEAEAASTTCRDTSTERSHSDDASPDPKAALEPAAPCGADGSANSLSSVPVATLFTAASGSASAPRPAADEAKLKLSFSDALVQLARKHGVYYPEGTIHRRSSTSAHPTSVKSTTGETTTVDKCIIRDEVVWWMYDSTQQPSAAKWYQHRHHHRSPTTSSNGGNTAGGGPTIANSSRTSNGALEVNHVEPPNSLLLLASMSHRPHTARAMLHAEDLELLAHVQWPLLATVAEIVQGDRRRCMQRNLEDPRRWGVAVDPPPIGEADSGEIVANSIDVCTTAAQRNDDVTESFRHDTHLRHRLMDFFERYDPQRMPSSEAVNAVLASAIPEQLLFDFLRDRYGLSASAPQMFLSAAPHHERAASHHSTVVNHRHASMSVAPEEPDAREFLSPHGSNPLARVRGDASPQVVGEASPDFCLVPGGDEGPAADSGAFSMLHSGSMATQAPGRIGSEVRKVVDATDWPEAWTTAVLPLVPASAEVVIDGGTWNSQASKPGLANPRSSFVVAASPTQLFTFGGVTMELRHETLEATPLQPPHNASAPLGGGGKCAVQSPQHSMSVLPDSENIGDLIIFPRSQCAALRVYQKARLCREEQHHVPKDSTVRADRHSCDVVDALDATLRSTTTLTSESPSPRRLKDASKRRHSNGKLSSDPFGDALAAAMLDSTLSWTRHRGEEKHLAGSSTSVNASRQARIPRRHVVLQHPVLMPPALGGESSDTACQDGSSELVLFLEDHWDLDDIDLRSVQSPLSFC